mmetsp:Transcript_33250/g.82665  ORF Transcript_33250/g.82665 Transcript_33250/m.82665 type:complete len:319 (+) Transcript_33250:1-957(+)
MHAIELLTEAIALEPQNASLYEARSRECGAAKKYQAVLHDGERLVELRPELAAGHAISGSALYCLGEFEQATHAYTRATNLEPADKSLEEARNDTAKKLGASLRQAAMKGDIPLLARFTRNRICDFDVRDENGFTPLTLAVVGGHAEAVAVLLKAGLLDTRDRFGKTALHWAASRNSEAIATMLLDGKADPAACDGGGWDVLRAAAHGGAYAIVKRLLANGGSEGGAVGEGGVGGFGEATRAVLRVREREDVPDALMCAAQSGHAHIVKLLLSAGADAGAKLAPKGLFALDLAEQGKHTGAAALLRPVTPLERFEQGL